MKFITLLLTLTLCASSALAATIQINDVPYPGTIDFDDYYSQKNIRDNSNAPYLPPSGETAATHDSMGLWQRLGNVNDHTDGVSWSVRGSDFGTTATLFAGEAVTFRYDFWQSNTGTHDYDQLVSFVDWNQDGVWSSDKATLWQNDPTVETIIYEKVDAVKNGNNDHQYDNDYIIRESEMTTFLVTITLPEDILTGSTWMRTRVHCWHVTYPNISAYGNLTGQGETLDFQLNIENPVPEPTTMALFAIGLVGLASFTRRRKNS